MTRQFKFLHLVFLLFCVMSMNSQNKKFDKVLRNPVYELLFTTRQSQKDLIDFDLSGYVNLGLSLGFEVQQDSNGNTFQEKFTERRVLKLTKRINGSIDLPGVPSYPVGIMNISFLVGKDDTYISKVITEIKLVEYSNVSKQQIFSFFNYVVELYNYWNNLIYRTVEEESLFDYQDFESLFSENYPIISKTQFEYTKYEEGKSFKFPSFSYSGRASRSIEDGDYVHSLMIMKEQALEEILYNKVVQSLKESENTEGLITEQLVINGNSLEDINTYDIRSMIDWFILDAGRFGVKFKEQNITSRFSSLEKNQIAVSKAFGIDEEVNIVVDPIQWEAASLYKKWYIIYHELGHDLLNLEHGQGGRMMFNYTQEDYSMEEFLRDREEMFTLYFQNQ